MTALHGYRTGVMNNHPCPPRLLALVAYARQSDPHFTADTHAPVRPTPVLAPSHVVTGSLRRGPMTGVVGRLIDWESSEIKRRTELAKRVLEMRPESVPYSEWSDRLAVELRGGTELEEIERRARQWAEEAKAN